MSVPGALQFIDSSISQLFTTIRLKMNAYVCGTAYHPVFNMWITFTFYITKGAFHSFIHTLIHSFG